jgi:hypothetical protein
MSVVVAAVVGTGWRSMAASTAPRSAHVADAGSAAAPGEASTMRAAAGRPSRKHRRTHSLTTASGGLHPAVLPSRISSTCVCSEAEGRWRTLRRSGHKDRRSAGGRHTDAHPRLPPPQADPIRTVPGQTGLAAPLCRPSTLPKNETHTHTYTHTSSSSVSVTRKDAARARVGTFAQVRIGERPGHGWHPVGWHTVAQQYALQHAHARLVRVKPYGQLAHSAHGCVARAPAALLHTHVKLGQTQHHGGQE